MYLDGPVDIELEQAVLGTIIEYPDTYDEAAPYLAEPAVLYDSQSRGTWKLLTEMRHKNEPIDLTSVCAFLSVDDTMVGITKSYIAEISSQASVSENIVPYAKKLYHKFLLRKIVKNAEKILETATSNSPNAFEAIIDAHSTLGRLIDISPGEEFSIENQMIDAISIITSKEDRLIKTGYHNIDKFAGGLTRGELSIVGGRPGHGKSTMLLNMLSRVIKSGKKVVLFNRELTNSEVLKKLIALESGRLSYGLIRKGIYDKGSLKELETVKETITKLYSEDKFRMFDSIQNFSRAATEIKKFKPDIVFDDYIQLIHVTGKEEQRRLQLEKLVHQYKWIAKENNCAVVLASQLNRAIETRTHQRPQLSDLAESGAMEQAAENVFFVFYKYKVSGNPAEKNEISLVASKVRYGESGETQLWYDGDKAKIYDGEAEFIDAQKVELVDDLPF